MNSDFTFFIAVLLLGFVSFGVLYMLKKYLIWRNKNDKNLYEKDEE